MSALPLTAWRVLAHPERGREVPKGLDAAWHRGLGVARRWVRSTGRYMRRAHEVVALEATLRDLASPALREQARGLREVFRRGRDTRDDLVRAFALVREVAARELGQRPYPVQIAGALALHDGCVAQMATGEGKTLAATLPASIAGWRGRGCHVITVNDYLAARDADWMGPIYRFCGVSVAALAQDSTAPERRAAYDADVTYCTNKEAAADFLRDRLAAQWRQGLCPALIRHLAARDPAAGGLARRVMRGLECAIVDEADSVLIDEAVTPLIISGEAPNPELADAFAAASRLALGLVLERDFRVDQRYREVSLTRPGRERLAELTRPLGGVWRCSRRREELVIQALAARELYQLGKQYIVERGASATEPDARVVIVDEFTGRLMPDRTWRDGFHQAVEAKESLTIRPPKDTLARISFQGFFRLYRRLCGMTGTGWEARGELWRVYSLPVVRIPTNLPCRRSVARDRVFTTGEAKWSAVVEQVKQSHARGVPVLVGVRSIAASEHLSALMTAAGLAHRVLNAVRHAEEAEIIAHAGQAGRITIATNMAGRGTDIRLGEGVAERGGLEVIVTERHEARRIDRQLFGRAARQGDPGRVRVFVSLEDELLTRYAARGAAFLRRTGGGASELRGRGAVLLSALAQQRAERSAARARQGVLSADAWLDEALSFSGGPA